MKGSMAVCVLVYLGLFLTASFGRRHGPSNIEMMNEERIEDIVNILDRFAWSRDKVGNLLFKLSEAYDKGLGKLRDDIETLMEPPLPGDEDDLPPDTNYIDDTRGSHGIRPRLLPKRPHNRGPMPRRSDLSVQRSYPPTSHGRFHPRVSDNLHKPGHHMPLPRLPSTRYTKPTQGHDAKYQSPTDSLLSTLPKDTRGERSGGRTLEEPIEDANGQRYEGRRVHDDYHSRRSSPELEEPKGFGTDGTSDNTKPGNSNKNQGGSGTHGWPYTRRHFNEHNRTLSSAPRRPNNDPNRHGTETSLTSLRPTRHESADPALHARVSKLHETGSLISQHKKESTAERNRKIGIVRAVRKSTGRGTSNLVQV